MEAEERDRLIELVGEEKAEAYETIKDLIQALCTICKESGVPLVCFAVAPTPEEDGISTVSHRAYNRGAEGIILPEMDFLARVGDAVLSVSATTEEIAEKVTAISAEMIPIIEALKKIPSLRDPETFKKEMEGEEDES